MPTMTSAAIRSLLIGPDRRNPNPKPIWSPDDVADVGPTWKEEEEEEEEEEEDFFETRESIRVASDGGDNEDMFGSGRSGSDYYEAAEDGPFFIRSQEWNSGVKIIGGGTPEKDHDYSSFICRNFFSDGSFPNSSPSFSTNNRREMQALRCNLIGEVERHKKAEMQLLHVRGQWKRMTKCLFKLGLSFPETKDSGNAKLVPDPAELCQEIIVRRFVSGAVERGLARAEAEAVAEKILDSKDHEISRLCDRVHYYEAVNHEMSRRNQETVELARQQSIERKKRWRVLLGCVGLSITIGASLLAYSHFAHSDKDTVATSVLDASSLTPATTVETEGGFSDS